MKLADRPYILTTNRAYSHVAASCWLTLKSESGDHASNSKCVCVHATSVHIQVGMCMYKNESGEAL